MNKGFKFFLVSFILSLPFWWGINIFQEKLDYFLSAQISKPIEEMVFIAISKKPQKKNLDLAVKSAISLRIDSNNKERILFQKNPEEILPIASLTKLMTAVIVLEDKNYDFKNTWITISQAAANQENVFNFGNLDSEIGKKFKVEKLLELMLIYSSNDAAFALVEFIGLENFIEKMNQKAKQLNLLNTYFINATGLDLEYFNYSTAKELIKLSQYIFFNYPLIFEISNRKGFYLVRDGLHDLILPVSREDPYKQLIFIGGKTGYTDKAGGCMLVIFQNEKGNIFFNLILGTKKGDRVKEMQKLINWLFL